MVSPEHVDKQKSEDKQAPSPAEEKEDLPVVVEIRAWLKPLMRAVGTIVPLICGFAWLWYMLEYQGDVQWWGLLAVFLLGAACAVLFHFWWAMVIVPLAFALGELLAFEIPTKDRVFYFPFDPSTLAIAVVLGFVAVALGSILGTLCSKWLEKQQWSVMVSPEHVDKLKPEDEQTSPPVEGKKDLPIVEETPPWLNPLMRAVGAIVPLIGGFVWLWVNQWTYDFWRYGLLEVILLLVLALLGGVGAAFFRSWWAMLFVPLALILGEFLAFFVGVVYFNYPYISGNTNFGVHYDVTGGLFMAILGAAIGSSVGKSWKIGRQQ
jgi:hypothetical protein